MKSVSVHLKLSSSVNTIFLCKIQQCSPIYKLWVCPARFWSPDLTWFRLICEFRRAASRGCCFDRAPRCSDRAWHCFDNAMCMCSCLIARPRLRLCSTVELDRGASADCSPLTSLALLWSIWLSGGQRSRQMPEHRGCLANLLTLACLYALTLGSGPPLCVAPIIATPWHSLNRKLSSDPNLAPNYL